MVQQETGSLMLAARVTPKEKKIVQFAVKQGDYMNEADPHALRTLRPGQFVILARSGVLGLGVFNDISWHKREKEHILTQLGITCEYGEEIQYGEDRGTFKTLGDGEHAQMVRDYIENTLGGMAKIAGAYNLSSCTVSNHMRRHNKAVETKGECEMCARVSSVQ